jgi:hypothetical protein
MMMSSKKCSLGRVLPGLYFNTESCVIFLDMLPYGILSRFRQKAAYYFFFLFSDSRSQKPIEREGWRI